MTRTKDKRKKRKIKGKERKHSVFRPRLKYVYSNAHLTLMSTLISAIPISFKPLKTKTNLDRKNAVVSHVRFFTFPIAMTTLCQRLTLSILWTMYTNILFFHII